MSRPHRTQPPSRTRWLAALLCLVWAASSTCVPPPEAAGAQAPSGAAFGAGTPAERRKALGELEESARLSQDRGEMLEAARALNGVGRLRLTLNDPRGALDAHRRALGLLEQTPAAEVRVDNLNGLAAAYLPLRELAAAEAALRESLALSRQSGYAAGEAESLLTLSRRQNEGNHATAVATALEALRLWQELGHSPGVARSHSSLGGYYLAQNSLAEAAEHLRQALGLWRELRDLPEQAEALTMLGFIESRKGEWQGSITFYTQAANLLDEEAEPGRMGQIAAGLGDAFNENGLPERGVFHFQRALEYYRRTGDPLDVTYALWGLGRSHFLAGDFAQALSCFQQSLAGVDGGHVYAALNFEYTGRVYLAEGRYAAALEYLEPALAIYQRAVNPKEEAQVRALIGQVYQRQGRAAPARRQYLRALAAFGKLSDRVNRAAVLYALGGLEMGRGDQRAAEAYLRQSIEGTEDVRRASTSRDLTAAFSATVNERYLAYVECLMRMDARDPSRGLAARAFEASESARARSLSELLRATGSNLVPGLDPQLAAQEQALRQTLRAREDERVALLGKKYKRSELESLDAEVARLEAEYGRVDETIRARHPAYGLVARAEVWDLRRIQERVVADDETVLLEYNLGAERGYGWAVTRDRVEARELPGREAVAAAARAVYELLSDPRRAGDEAELGRAAGELSRMVLAPFAGALGGRRRVIVVADGALNYVPFQLLPDPAAGGEPLVAAREVVNAPSASTLGQLREETSRRRAHAKTLAAFGDPVFASNYAARKGTGDGAEVAALRRAGAAGWGHALRGIEVGEDSFDPATIRPLFFAGEELQNLREVAAGHEALVASGFGATRERLQATDLSEYAILHFATHGRLNPKQPENSGLMLSTVDEEGRERAGLVTLRDVYGLRAPVGLVVLSACQTALGKEVAGEGIVGLTRGFMYAGASGVVSSLWKVDDEAAAELMKRFYANMLREGMTPAEALRAAQNSIRQVPEWRSPHHWAAFTLHGEYRQVFRPARPAAAAGPDAKAAAVAALLLLALCAAWWYRRRVDKVA